jgi:hypothetical protein
VKGLHAGFLSWQRLSSLLGDPNCYAIEGKFIEMWQVPAYRQLTTSVLPTKPQKL